MNRYESLSAVMGVGSGLGARCAGAALALGAGLASAAWAAPQSLSARQRPNETSSFTLDFGVFGGERQANITTTQFRLEIDDAAGTARFLTYSQEVEPILLPGDISTGNITVEIVPGSSEGTYIAETGWFYTSEMYAVYFDGDLSAYGLESPVYLPSESAGQVTFIGPRFGAIGMDWSGDGVLANPFDPQTPITFQYTCAVEATFGVRAITPTDVTPSEEPLRMSAERALQTDDVAARPEMKAAQPETDAVAARCHEEATEE